MKYIKHFENTIEDSIKKCNEKMAKKALDYKKYYDKYVIFKYKEDYYLAKFISVNSYYSVNLEIYMWNPDDLSFECKLTDILYIYEIYVKSSYDNIKDAKKEYLLILDTNKFNL